MTENPGSLPPSRTKTDAPDPDSVIKPASPTDLTRASWRYIARKVVREFVDDDCVDLAAALTFWAVLALLPATLTLVSLLGVFGRGAATVQALLEVAEQIGGQSVVDIVRQPVERLVDAPSAGLALALGLVVALWSSSGYVSAFSRAMNRVYEIDEGRPWWKLRPFQMVITIVAVLAAALVGLALVVTGPIARGLGNVIGLGSAAVTAWEIAKWPVIVMVVVLIVAVLYYTTPNVQQAKFRWLSLGAGIAILTWLAVSALFGLYVSRFADYDRVYGSLAGVIVFLLWLWITNLALLFGAEVNAEVERGRELQAGLAAEHSLQLPPRDTRASDKDLATEEEHAERGRWLRRTRGQRSTPE